MEPHIYDILAQQEDSHWWFAARRRIVGSVLDRFLPARRDLVVLDAGCGTGGNFSLLTHYGKVFAFELHLPAREKAAARNLATVEDGSLPNSLPFPDQQFDLITMFDVLEHIKEDASALAALHTKLNENGLLLLTVPAFPFLWSHHDVQHHHFRRYTRTQLTALLQQNGFTVELCNHFNFWLFPAALAARLVDRLRNPAHAALGAGMPAPWLNNLLTTIMASEHRLVPRFPLPFGVSLIAVARKA